MNKSVCVISPKCTNISARWLADYIGADYFNPNKIKAHPDFFSTYEKVVNYGYSGKINANNIINPPESVMLSINKIDCFKSLGTDCLCVPWTTDMGIALGWLEKSYGVVIRETEIGRKSSGTTMTYDPQEVLSKPAKLYTRFLYTEKEYRVNVFNGKVISVLEKTRGEDGNFAFKLIRKSPYTFSSFIKAIDKNLGLSLYGMDIILRKNDRKLYLLEVNSGPALFGYTSIQMASAIKKELNK